MNKVVVFISAVPDLGVFKFIKETGKKYKFQNPNIPEWSHYVLKKEAVYFGEETKELKDLQEAYKKAQEEIKKNKNRFKGI